MIWVRLQSGDPGGHETRCRTSVTATSREECLNCAIIWSTPTGCPLKSSCGMFAHRTEIFWRNGSFRPPTIVDTDKESGFSKTRGLLPSKNSNVNDVVFWAMPLFNWRLITVLNLPSFFWECSKVSRQTPCLISSKAFSLKTLDNPVDISSKKMRNSETSDLE